MSTNNPTAFNSPLVHSRSNSYPYLKGFPMAPCAEFASFFDDAQEKVTTNLPSGWEAAIIDTGATLVSLGTDTFSGGAWKIASDGASDRLGSYQNPDSRSSLPHTSQTIHQFLQDS